MTSENVPENLKQRLKETYDSIAPKYNAWTIPHSQDRLEFLDRLLSLLDENSSTGDAPSPVVRVLELGCGGGIPTTQKLLSRTNFHVTANDMSGVQLALARENLLGAPGTEGSPGGGLGDRLELVEGDMTALDFPEGSLDAVVAMYSLIHLPLAEQTAMLAKTARWLRPGRGLLLANFSAEAVEGKVLEHWLGEDRGWVFWSGFGAEGMPGRVRAAGLEIVAAEVRGGGKVDADFLWVLARSPEKA